MSNRKIFYYCPCFDSIYGGAKQIYRHVSVLCQNGFNAFVFHSKKGFRYDWFKHNAIFCYDATEIKSDDYLVIPEVVDNYVMNLISRTNNVIVFNQNCYNTFDSIENITKHTNFSVPLFFETKIKAFLTVSINSANYLRYVFPGTPVINVVNGIDDTIFYYNPSEKRKIISYMDRKLSKHSCQVVNILRRKIDMNLWQIIRINNCNESHVAKILRKTSIFMSFADDEGFSLPALEALASGCQVIGYHGNGGKEYFHEEFVTTIEHGDIIEFVKQIIKSISKIEFNDQIAKQASEFSLLYYSLSKESSSVLMAWKKIISFN